MSEKAMAPHSSTLAWKIPWTEEPGRLQSMGSLGVGHNWATSLSHFTFMHWRKKWQPTPVFLPGESQGQQSLVGCHLWGRTESDTTEARQQQQQQWNIYIFLMWTIFKVFIEFVIISLRFYVLDFFFFFFFFWPWDTWGLSCLTRDRTHIKWKSWKVRS